MPSLLRWSEVLAAGVPLQHRAKRERLNSIRRVAAPLPTVAAVSKTVTMKVKKAASSQALPYTTSGDEKEPEVVAAEAAVELARSRAEAAEAATRGPLSGLFGQALQARRVRARAAVVEAEARLRAARADRYSWTFVVRTVIGVGLALAATGAVAALCVLLIESLYPTGGAGGSGVA